MDVTTAPSRRALQRADNLPAVAFRTPWVRRPMTHRSTRARVRFRDLPDFTYTPCLREGPRGHRSRRKTILDDFGMCSIAIQTNSLSLHSTTQRCTRPGKECVLLQLGDAWGMIELWLVLLVFQQVTNSKSMPQVFACCVTVISLARIIS